MYEIKRLQRLNNELRKNLTPANQKVMTDMVVYLRVSRISDHRIELIRQDLLEMALAAQERDEPLSNVFGEDYKFFCDEIIASVKPERFKKFVEGLPYLLSTVGLLGILNLVSSRYFRQFIHDMNFHAATDLNYPITLGFIVNTVLIYAVVVAIVQLIGKFSFRTDHFLARFHGAPVVSKFIIGGLLGLAVFLYLFWTQRWHGIVMFHINIWAYLAINIPLFAVWVYFFGVPKTPSKVR